ncbi:MAG TPA: DUF3566 domain-containing protein [Jatrophihabitantaceae bacterium]|jgi:hypothetical protein
MTGPRYSRETFATPDPTAFAPGDERNGADPGANGAPGSEENVEETRPRASFGVPGTGPAGGFEARPFAPPPGQPLSEPMPPSDHGDGFSQPTLAGGGGPASAPMGPTDNPGFGDATGYVGSAPSDQTTGYVEPSYAEPGYADSATSYAPPPAGYAEPPGGFGDRPGLGDQPPSYDRPGFPGPSGASGPGAGYGEPTVGLAGSAGPAVGAPAGMAPPLQPPMGPPSGPGAAAGARSQQRARGPRRAKLQLRHINPWTVLKFSCVLSVALFFVWLITIGLLYGILQAAGVIDNINSAATTINGSGSKDPVTPGLVFGGSAIIGVVNVVLFIALSTVGSVVYNLCADLVGGIEVTLSERD